MCIQMNISCLNTLKYIRNDFESSFCLINSRKKEKNMIQRNSKKYITCTYFAHSIYLKYSINFSELKSDLHVRSCLFSPISNNTFLKPS